MRKQYKIPYKIREYVKNELYQYWDNCKALEELEKEILEESADPPDGQPKGNGAGKPTERKAVKIIEQTSTRRMITLEKKIKAIERVFKRLVPEEMEVVEMIFKQGKSQVFAYMNYHISKDTYYNTMNKVIFLTAKEFGEI